MPPPCSHLCTPASRGSQMTLHVVSCTSLCARTFQKVRNAGDVMLAWRAWRADWASHSSRGGGTEVMALPEMPFDPRLPSFVSHTDALAYILQFAARTKHGHTRHLNTRVLSVEPVAAQSPSTRWRVTSETNVCDGGAAGAAAGGMSQQAARGCRASAACHTSAPFSPC